MLFNSLHFAFFLPIVFFFYWFVLKKSLKWQNILLIVCSYYFYACWDWRFLFLLIFSTLLDYFSGIQIENSTDKKRKKFWLITSVAINLGFLGVFKYYNFFIDSFADFLSQIGFQVHLQTLQIILPVGISFYTFHGLSYVFDVYNEKVKSHKNFVEYSLFVSFFPLLVAGPIERADHLLPQMKIKKQFDYQMATDGLRQILWGLFKKMVIADNCSTIVNEVFSNYQDASTGSLIIGAVFFAFQIYGDFSGYSDIAIGTGKLFGFQLLKNFNYPYFSRDIAEFWRRWHISLSSWFKDYLYIPLGGSQGGIWMKIRNTFIIFLVSGFWHGANWTFIIWGGLNALYFLPLLILKQNRKNTNVIAENTFFPSFREVFSVLITFALTCFAWIFFRAKNLTEAFGYIQQMCTNFTFSIPKIRYSLLICVFIFFFFEWINRKKDFGLDIGVWNKFFRHITYLFIILLILLFASFGQNEFIYFQF